MHGIGVCQAVCRQSVGDQKRSIRLLCEVVTRRAEGTPELLHKVLWQSLCACLRRAFSSR